MRREEGTEAGREILAILILAASGFDHVTGKLTFSR
jgi:hypothetical protein